MGVDAMIYVDIAYNIKKMREAKGMTQKAVARIMGISQQAYAQYETGKRIPKQKTIERIAEALGVQYSAFFGLEDAKSPAYQTALDLALKDSMNGRGEIDGNAFFENSRQNNAIVRYYDLVVLSKKTDDLYIDQLQNMPDEELKEIAMLSFAGLNRVGKIEAVKRLSELEQLPRYSTWSKKIIGEEVDLDDAIAEYKQAAPQPAGENQAETSAQAPAGDGQSGEK